MRTSQRMLEPVRHAGDEIHDLVRHKPRFGIVGLFLLGLLVALGIWAWPELHRTVHMHRM